MNEQQNRERYLGWKRNYRKRHAKDILDKATAYYYANKEARLLYQKTYAKKKYKTDAVFKIKTCLSARLRRALYCHKITKSYNTMELVGCTVEDLKNYLESKFLPGMTWNNYGYHGWHIDHIKPCALFNLTDLEEQKKCFHYTNLQPLWKVENIQKGNKYEQMAFN